MICADLRLPRLLAPLIAGFLSAVATARADAQSLQVAPISVELPAGRMAGTVVVTNRSDAPTAIQVRPFLWDQNGGDNHLTPTRDLLVSPPFTTVGPGESQTVRVVLRRPATGKEDSYRLLIDELPPPQTTPGAVRVALRISMPVFALPRTAVAPSLGWRVVPVDATHATLLLRNDGTRHARVFGITLALPGATLAVATTSFAYVLPTSETAVPITVAGPLAPGTTVKVSARSDGGELHADAPVVARP